MSQPESLRPFPTDPPPNSVRRGSGQPDSQIRLDDRGPVREIILDRRHKRNAITVGMYMALTAALLEAETNDRTHVVVLSSAGGAFSVGSDLVDFAEARAAGADPGALARAVADFATALAHFSKPVVAAVNGLAAGVGAAILLHCDFVIASESAAFEFSSAKVGMLPDAASSVLLGARIGPQRASECLFMGERVDPRTALQLGLVNAVVVLENLEKSVRARAELLSRFPQATLRETKRLLREPLRVAVEDAIARELEAALVAKPISIPPPGTRSSMTPPPPSARSSVTPPPPNARASVTPPPPDLLLMKR